MVYLGRKRSNKTLDNDGYRPNVAIIVSNPTGQVLWARRVAHDGWQFPQGGVEYKESPREAAYRELYEEVGLYPHQVRLLGNTREWYRYDVPRRSKMSGAFKGQKQQWYLFQLTGKEEDIQLGRGKKSEFDNWC